MPEREEVKPATDALVRYVKKTAKRIVGPLDRRVTSPAIEDARNELALIARIEHDAETIEQLTEERDGARAVILDTVSDMECEPGCYADPVANPNGDHAENCPVAYPAEAWRRLRAEVERLLAIVGGPCPQCSHFTRAYHEIGPSMDDTTEDVLYCSECDDEECITVADLIANHPAIARELGVSE